MNTTNKFFQNKQSYLAFRKAFAAAQNNEEVHLYSTHFLFFNLVCGRPFFNGFTPKTRKNFIANGGDPDRAIRDAIQHLRVLVADTKIVLNPSHITPPSWIKDKDEHIAKSIKRYRSHIDSFLAPFNGAITLADFAQLSLPSIPTSDGKPYADVVDKGEVVIAQSLIPTEIESQVETPQAEEKKGFFRKMFGS